MTDASSPQANDIAGTVGADAVTRILQIARAQAGTEIAFIAEVLDGVATILFCDGEPDVPPVDSARLTVLCELVAGGSIPAFMPETSLEPALQSSGLKGCLAADQLFHTDGTPMGVLVCMDRRPSALSVSADSRMLRVFGRAIANLLDQYGLVHSAGYRPEIERIRSLLDGTGLAMVFQPIVDLETLDVAGYEALARFNAEPQRGPDRWFAEAANVNLGTDLEMTAVRAALATLDGVPHSSFLSINASTATVTHPIFMDLIAGIRPERLVVELTDHAQIEDDLALRRALVALSASGVLVATDVSDAGYSTLSMLFQQVPDIIKIDGLLIRDVDTDPVRRALVTTLVGFAQEIEATVVAKSIQTESELATLLQIGVARGQGNILAPPGPLPVATRP